MGGLATFVDFLDVSPDLTVLANGDKQKIQQLGGVIRRQPIDQIRGPIEDKISTLLGIGGQQIPETPI